MDALDAEQWKFFFTSCHFESGIKKRESTFVESRKIQVITTEKKNLRKIKKFFTTLNAQFPTILFKINLFSIEDQRKKKLIRPTILVDIEDADFDYYIPKFVKKKNRLNFPVMFLFIRQKNQNFKYTSFLSSEADPYPLPRKPDSSEKFFVLQMIRGKPYDASIEDSNENHSTMISTLDDKINRLGLVALSQWLTVVTYQPEITIPLDDDIIADPLWRRGDDIPLSFSTALLPIPESEVFKEVYPLKEPLEAYPQYLPLIYVDTNPENTVRKRGQKNEPIRTLHELYQEKQKSFHSKNRSSTNYSIPSSSSTPSSSSSYSSSSIPSSSSSYSTQFELIDDAPSPSKRSERTVAFDTKKNLKVQRMGAKLNQFFI